MTETVNYVLTSYKIRVNNLNLYCLSVNCVYVNVLFANDLVLIDENINVLEAKLEHWRKMIENK